MLKNLLEKVQENGLAGRKKKKDKTDTVTGLRRKTREERVKWNQMTALRFQTGGDTSDITSLISLQGHKGRKTSDKEMTGKKTN